MPVPTPFHPRTSELCTSLRWKEWAGYHAVCSYDTTHDPEYAAFRQTAGLLDVSPLFKYSVTGSDAAGFLARVMTKNIVKLRRGRMTYCCMCDGNGHLIDDGTVARLDQHTYRVTSASPALRWLRWNSRGYDVHIEDESENVAALALQGPRSRAILANASDSEVKLRFFRVESTAIAGHPVEISRTGYTGDLGYEVWMSHEYALAVWDAIMAAGAPHGIAPAGLDALDVTRIEAGFVLHDVDYYSAPRAAIESRKSTPFEMGLGWTVDLEREPFIGQRALREEKRSGSRWALVGLEISWEELEELYDREQLPPALPAHAWRTPIPVYNGGRQVGRATSGAWSPILKKNLALASVEARHSALGTKLRVEHTVEFRRETVGAVVVERPFFDPPRKRRRW